MVVGAPAAVTTVVCGGATAVAVVLGGLWLVIKGGDILLYIVGTCEVGGGG